MSWLILGILLLEVIMSMMLIAVVYTLEDISRSYDILKDILDKLEDLRRY